MTSAAVKTISLRAGNGGLVLPAAFAKHSATVILMHGLGDSADGLEDLAQIWRRQLPHVKFVVPTAPQRPVTLNMGQSMNAWYNIVGLDDRTKDPCDGLEESTRFVHSLISSEQSLGLPRSRIMLAGFSQGGALSLFSGLQLPADQEVASQAEDPLAGLLVLSGYIPKLYAFKLHSAYSHVPVFHCHGEADPVIRVDWASKTRDHLLSLGLSSYTLKTYAGVGHSLSMEIVQEAARFIEKVLPHDSARVLRPPSPKSMSVRELKEAIRDHGLTSQAVGLTEKQELVQVVETFYRAQGVEL